MVLWRGCFDELMQKLSSKNDSIFGVKSFKNIDVSKYKVIIGDKYV